MEPTMIFVTFIFLLSTFLLGYFLSKNLELINIGYGLSMFIVLFVALRIPVKFTILIGIIVGVLFLIFKRRHILKQKIKYDKFSLWFILLLLLCGGFFTVYHKGAFAYPWLEDGDPWHHAKGVVWTADHNSFSIPYIAETYSRESYLEPYPPGYDVVMALMYQTHPDVIWVLKFFNVLIITLGLLFSFYFGKEIFKKESSAFLFTSVLAAMPCFMSHFVWAQTLAVVLMFPAMYSLMKKQYFISIICTAAILLVQPTTGFIYGIFFYVPYLLLHRKVWVFLTGLFGVLLSFVYWGMTLIKFGYADTMKGVGWVTGFVGTLTESGSFGIKYTLSDFFTVKSFNMIDQMTGVGWFICLMTLVGIVWIIYKLIKKQQVPKMEWWALIVFVITFLTVISNYFPINFVPHRMWVYMSIPLAVLAVYSYELLINKMKGYEQLSKVIIIIFVLLIFFSSWIPKAEFQTREWPPGDSFGYDMDSVLYGLNGFISLQQNFPEGTGMLDLCWDSERVISYGMKMPVFDEDLKKQRKNLGNITIEEISSTAQNKNLEYVIISPVCLRFMSLEKINFLLLKMHESKDFEVIMPMEQFSLWRIK